MKSNFFLLILFVVFANACIPQSIQEECPVTVKVLEETFKDNFFNKYRINGKLIIETKNKKIYEDIVACNSTKNLSFSVDTLRKNKLKYLTLNNYDLIGNTFRLQVMCYNSIKAPYSTLYSTSFEVDNDKIRLIKGVSPFIETVQIKKR